MLCKHSTSAPRGMTLLELMGALAILAIAAALAIPSFREMIEKNQLRKATEQLYNELKFVRSESLKNNQNMYVNFSGTTAWCFGVDNTSTCNCGTSNDCQVSGTTFVRNNNSEFGNIDMAVTGFTGNNLTFNGVRATASQSGTVTYSINGKDTVVKVNRMGSITVCSDTLSEFEEC